MSEETMNAVRFHGQKDIRLETIPVPKVTQPNHVKIAPKFCGICGTDLVLIPSALKALSI